MVVLSPHSDDAPLSVGGTIPRLGANHKVIVYIIFGLSRFTRFRRFRNRVAVTAYRWTEERMSSLVLGYQVRYFAFPDSSARAADRNGPSNHLPGVRETLLSHLANDRPETILCPLGVGNHPDHVTLARTIVDLMLAGVVKTSTCRFYEDLPYSTFYDTTPSVKSIEKALSMKMGPVLIDVTKTIASKISALKIYKSQLRSSNISRVEDYARTLAEEETKGSPHYHEREWVIAS
ncbi:MAG: PIG-L family deacetylase [Thaumarchaeota archaeon]|nr:PIG-L family deacetylase [Nitrososphaerota archaeon]